VVATTVDADADEDASPPPAAPATSRPPPFQVDDPAALHAELAALAPPSMSTPSAPTPASSDFVSGDERATSGVEEQEGGRGGNGPLRLAGTSSPPRLVRRGPPFPAAAEVGASSSISGDPKPTADAATTAAATTTALAALSASPRALAAAAARGAFDDAALERGYLRYKTAAARGVDATALAICGAMITIAGGRLLVPLVLRGAKGAAAAVVAGAAAGVGAGASAGAGAAAAAAASAVALSAPAPASAGLKLLIVAAYGVLFFAPYVLMLAKPSAFAARRERALALGRAAAALWLGVVGALGLPFPDAWYGVIANSHGMQLQNAFILPACQQLRVGPSAAAVLVAQWLSDWALYAALRPGYPALAGSFLTQVLALLTSFALDFASRRKYVARALAESAAAEARLRAKVA
jgi:hypothetical protein